MKKLSDFFRGYDKAHGVFESGTARAGVKVEGKAYTVSEPLTEAKWDVHIAGGRQGIGVVPLLEDNTLYWGGIDVDQYDIKLPDLSKKIADFPLILFRSKSGGAHLICFAREPVPAGAMVKILKSLARQLGFPPKTEIFPKQITRGVDKDGNPDVGNWLNMPYYGGDRSSRYALVDGEPLSVAECIAYLEQKALTADQFLELAGSAPDADPDDPFAAEEPADLDAFEESKLLEEDEGATDPEPEPRPRPRLVQPPKDEPHDDDSNVESLQFADGPPCLQTLAARGGFTEFRNNGMFNVAVYLAKKYPSSWRDHINEFNQTLCTPPLKQNELVKTVERSTGRKEYSYKCNDSPINSVCRRPVCLARKYGVGVTEGKISDFRLIKHESDPVVWDVIFVGETAPMHLSSEELYSQTAFGKKTMEFKNIVLPQMPENRWRALLNDKVKSAEILEEAEDEETRMGNFKRHLEKFCTGRAPALNWDDTQSDHVYTVEGMSWFRGGAFMDYLSSKGFRYQGREPWFMLQVCGGVKKTIIAGGTDVFLWGVPEFKKTEEEKALPDSLKDFEKGGTEHF